MKGGAGRAALSTAGAIVGAIIVAVFEAVRGSRVWPAPLGGMILGDAAVIVPIATAVGLAVAAIAVGLDPSQSWSVSAMFARLVAAPRSRAAARVSSVALVAPAALLVWVVMCAYAGRGAFEKGTPVASGVEVSVVAVVSLSFAVCAVFALVAAVERHVRSVIDPRVAVLCGCIYAIALGVIGIRTGNASGDGPLPLAILGVLARPELDLSPLIALLTIASCAWIGEHASAVETRNGGWVVLAALVVSGLGWGLVVHEAHALTADARVARAIETTSPLGRIGLSLARRATDRDGDGASALFGGGDCDDVDPQRSPNAIDVPGNGIDEDCSGADTPIRRRSAPVPKPATRNELNLVLVTIDTLRVDLGFMGYSRPVSPNLDALAARATVFDRAYSMASYTGKSVGPTMIGKYPSECLRDGAHFDTYFPENTFLAERLKDAGFRTLGAASHWYFRPKFGLTQGMDVWDTSALPAEYGRDADSSVTSERVTDAAVGLLSDPANVSRRFFLWVHYFDPHANYVQHPDAPDFRSGAKGWAKPAYDGEVWFTDRHVGRLLDYVRSQPWGKKTAIIVTADHGEAFDEHGMNWHGVDLWEPLVRVPLVVYVPGVAAHRVSAKRSLIDLVPTALELMGLPVPGPTEVSGESMAASIVSPNAPAEERDVYMDMPPGPQVSQHRALIHGTTPGMKLMSEGGHVYLLFDLASDPGELNDLSRDRAALSQMKAALDDKLGGLRMIRVDPAPNQAR